MEQERFELPYDLLGLLVNKEARYSGFGLVSWGLKQLESGVESPSLIILAGLSKQAPWSDTEPYFQMALQELGVIIPEDKALARIHALHLWKNIACGQWSLIDYELVRRLNSGVFEESLQDLFNKTDDMYFEMLYHSSESNESLWRCSDEECWRAMEALALQILKHLGY